MYTWRPSIIADSLEDPADPDSIQSGATPVGRRSRSLEAVDDPVQCEVEFIQFEDAFTDGHLVSAEVVDVDRSRCDFDVQVGVDNVRLTDDRLTAAVRAVEGVQVAVVAVDLGVIPSRRGTYDEREITSTLVVIIIVTIVKNYILISSEWLKTNNTENTP